MFACDSQADIVERLVAAGNSAAAVNAAINLVRSGHITLLQRVLDRDLDVEIAWQIARQQRRQS
jgi:hypothetical protein